MTNAEASEAKNTAAPFRSSAPPNRPRGIFSSNAPPCFASTAFDISLGNQPGASALTRMPREPHFEARSRVKVIRPPLLVLYPIASSPVPMPRRPAIDAMLRIDPRPAASITRPAAWENRKLPVRLVSSTLVQSGRAISSAGAPQEVPALLTRKSIRPNRSIVAATVASTLSGSFTSQASARTSAPPARSSSAACSHRGSLRAHKTRRAPASASPSAICRPSPTEPPVTTATRPVRSNSERTSIPAPSPTERFAYRGVS